MSLLKPFASLVLTLVAMGALGAQTPAAPPAQPGTPSAQDVATSLQRKYDTIRDFSADFVQRYEGGVLKRTREERGTLLVKKPGKMRWTYKAPDEKVFVSNGVRLYQYLPQENRVIVSPPPDQDDSAGMQFLAGRGNITRDFTITFGKTSAPDSWTLHLEAKRPQPTYDWLEITAARESLRIQSLTVAEKQGSRSTFLFTNFKENPGLSDKQFEFSIPRNAQVEDAQPVKR
jgi:outer membrane lipoprotein carrier protein